jgi:hypothetical protein
MILVKHVSRMGGVKRNTYRLLVGKPEGKEQLRKPYMYVGG